MNIFLLVFSIVMNLLSCALLRNEYCKRDIKTPTDLYLFNALSGAASVIVLLAVCAYTKTLQLPSLYTLGLGALFGVATALCAVFGMKALESGPLSYTNTIISCAMVIPAFSGVLFFDEHVSVWQYIGVAFMVLSFILAVDKKNGEAGTSLRWLLLCLVAFLSNGAVGVMQKVQQNSAWRQELGMFLVVAFAVYVLFSLALAFVHRNRGEKATVTAAGRRKKLLFFAAVTGFGVAACNQINLFLTGVIPAIIFFPVFNGAVMILTAALGILVWKEKLSFRQKCGLAAGAAAILLLCDIIK